MVDSAIPGPCIDVEAECERLQIRVTTAWPRQVSDLSLGRPLGKIYKIVGRSCKAVCKQHPDCSLFLNLVWFRNKGGEPAAVLALCKWLAEASTTNEQQHFTSRSRISREAKA